MTGSGHGAADLRMERQGTGTAPRASRRSSRHQPMPGPDLETSPWISAGSDRMRGWRRGFRGGRSGMSRCRTGSADGAMDLGTERRIAGTVPRVLQKLPRHEPRPRRDLQTEPWICARSDGLPERRCGFPGGCPGMRRCRDGIWRCRRGSPDGATGCRGVAAARPWTLEAVGPYKRQTAIFPGAIRP
jgi:hypothetical protein